MTRTEALHELIRLGKQYRDYWNRALPLRHPKWPLIQTGENSGPSPEDEAEIQAFLASLDEEDLYLLCLLMHVGRGDYDIDQLWPAYQKLRDAFPSRDVAMDQLLGKPELSEYLTEAWEEVQQRHIDLDHLSFAPAITKS